MKRVLLVLAMVFAGCGDMDNAAEVGVTASPITTFDFYPPAAWGTHQVLVWAGDLNMAGSDRVAFIVMKDGVTGACTTLQFSTAATNKVNQQVTVHGSPLNDAFTVGQGATTCNGVSFTFTWFGEANLAVGPPAFNGEGGPDVFYASGHDYILDGGDGADSITASVQGGPAFIYGRGGNDKIFTIAQATGTIINGGDGDDCVWTEFPAPAAILGQLTCGAGFDVDGWVPNPPPSPYGNTSTTACESHTASYRCGL